MYFITNEGGNFGTKNDQPSHRQAVDYEAVVGAAGAKLKHPGGE